MLDSDLAKLYEVKTKPFNQTVRRNLKRFPEDFMFRLTDKKFSELVTNCDRFNRLKHSSSKPLVFTEQGVAMLSSVLRSERAINVNIAIIRSFVHLRKLMETNKGLELIIRGLEEKYYEHGKQLTKIFGLIEELIKQEDDEKKRIGFDIS